MEYRSLAVGPSKSLQVSVLGFGCSPLGGVFDQNQKPIEATTASELIERAVSKGINFFDTAPFYGNTKSETVLGAGLKLSNISRESIILSTKVGRYGATDFDFSASTVEKSVKESIQRLQVDYLDIVHCHDVEYASSLDQVLNEAIPTLRMLQTHGLIRHIGISGFPLSLFSSVLDKEKADVVLSYAHHCLSNNTLVSLLPYFKERNTGVINASPLAMGLLQNHNRELVSWHPSTPELRARAIQAAQYCIERDLSLSDIATYYATKNIDIPTTLVGFSNLNQIDEAVAVVSASEEQKNKWEVASMEILEIFKQPRDEKQQTSWSWPSGLSIPLCVPWDK